MQGPDRKPLNALGSVNISLKYKDKCTNQEVYVIKGLNHNLLGLPAIEALQLVAMVDTVQDETALIKEKFPSLFKGLGSISTEYTIRLKPGEKTICIIYCSESPNPAKREGPGRVTTDARPWSDLQSGPLHPMVRRHGGGTKEDW